MIRRAAYVLAALLVVAPLLWAAIRHVREDAAWALARAAATAHERTGYTGRAAWRHGKWGWSVAVTHDAESGWTRYGWGWGAYTVQGPSSRNPDPAAWCLDLGALEKSYRAREEQPTRFLDRSARTVVLEPRHEARPWLRLTLDAETMLPLQVASHRPDGSLYRVAAFREVEIGAQSVEAPTRQRHHQRWFGNRVDGPGLDEALGFHALVPDSLPPGFRCIESRVSTAWSTPKAIMVFSDGVTAFEISQRTVPTPAQLEAAMVRRHGPRRGARMAEKMLNDRLRALAQGGDADALCRRHKFGMHTSYELRVGEREVRMTAREDLDGEEVLRVLRSLRPR